MELWYLAGALFASMLLGGYLGIRFDAWRRSRKAKKAAKVAAASAAAAATEREKLVAGLLKERGYTIVGRQAPASYAVSVDGEPQMVHIAADYLLEQAGKKLVAELKSGAAAKLDNPATRGQLLEHQLAFGVQSVLVIDPATKELRSVRFPVGKNVLNAVAPPPKPPPLPAKPAKKKKKTLHWVAFAVAACAAFWMLRS